MERRNKQARLSRSKEWFKSKKLISRLVVVFIGIIFFGLLVFTILITFSDVSKLDIVEPRPTYIYDINGEVASKVSNSKIEGVSLDQIPTELIEAFVATEDQHFYKHNGINYFGITKAFMKNLVKGEVVAGGSTITQQLSKNVFLTSETTYTRKFKELIFTKKIERTYSKDEIMERYLNQIYFGEGAWGIQRAAHVYFGKDVSELTLNESATLAGLVKAPSNLSPYKNMGKALDRRNIVLSLMKSEGYISQQDLDKNLDQPIVLTDKETIDYKGKYPYYVDYLIEEAVNMYGLTENEVLSGGLHIYTELNPVIQDATEEVYQNEDNFPDSKPDQLIQSGSVFLNPKTGGISALVGGRGDYTYKRFNNATNLVRQPGSALKPLAVYTSALEQGYDFDDMLVDEPINIDGYQPQNIDKRYRGHVTLYDALINSYNIPPVWLLNEIGIEKGFSTVERFGIPLEKEDHNLGLALGGLHQGTSPLLMAQAFSAFPNDGIMMQAHAISEIKDAEGKIIGKWSDKSSQVTEPEVAQKMTYMLKGVVDNGTARNAQIPGIDVAGKTGTTQLPFPGVAGSKDHWFVGYTPDLVGATWLGYDKTDQAHYLTATSGVTVTTIFQQIVSKSISELPNKEFNLPLVEKKKKKQSKRKENGQKKDKENKKDKEDKKDKGKDRDKEHKKDMEDKRNKDKDKDKDRTGTGTKTKTKTKTKTGIKTEAETETKRIKIMSET
ncbi:PBP1A family penicillin-binding protein [Sporosarcina sp. resist]|uniref:transglycosylase domain-containing protein n=1 Tax=Sporosarcina sp. resist TaxID=2762563 RepID=UPI00164DF357|nr:PBP1A family penicillin-binding protein [Sporosarcina sp. resist]QNK90654.1 PBP1A family penicillin-binding protein [Sporosarcina sp. resist]